MKIKKGDLVTINPDFDDHYIPAVRFESSFIAKVLEIDSWDIQTKVIQSSSAGRIGDHYNFQKENLIVLNEAIKRGFKI